MVKEEKLLVKHSLLWIFLSLSLLFIVLIPKTTDFIASFLGIAEPINALFFYGIYIHINSSVFTDYIKFNDI